MFHFLFLHTSLPAGTFQHADREAEFLAFPWIRIILGYYLFKSRCVQTSRKFTASWKHLSLRNEKSRWWSEPWNTSGAVEWKGRGAETRLCDSDWISGFVVLCYTASYGVEVKVRLQVQLHPLDFWFCSKGYVKFWAGWRIIEVFT